MASKSKSASTSTIAVTAQVLQPHGPPTGSELSRSQFFNSAEMQGYTIRAELIVCSAPLVKVPVRVYTLPANRARGAAESSIMRDTFRVHYIR